MQKNLLLLDSDKKVIIYEKFTYLGLTFNLEGIDDQEVNQNNANKAVHVILSLYAIMESHVLWLSTLPKRKT